MDLECLQRTLLFSRLCNFPTSFASPEGWMVLSILDYVRKSRWKHPEEALRVKVQEGATPLMKYYNSAGAISLPMNKQWLFSARMMISASNRKFLVLGKFRVNSGQFSRGFFALNKTPRYQRSPQTRSEMLGLVRAKWIINVMSIRMRIMASVGTAAIAAPQLWIRHANNVRHPLNSNLIQRKT